MSLNIVLRKDVESISENNIIKDVEIGFLKCKFKGTELERKALNVIEHGEYLDEYSFIDRFGYKLYSKFISTGCKAAICVDNLPDKYIDTRECGDNAIAFIVSNFNKGNIIIGEQATPILCKESEKIDVIIDGINFTSIKELNEYLDDKI